MAMKLLQELGSRCWYCGEGNPIHDKLPDYEANGCRSCVRLRRKRTLEEFRLVLGGLYMVPGVDLQELEAITDRTEEQNRALEQMTREQAQEYKFYLEQIAMEFAGEMEGCASIHAWDGIKSLSSDDLMKELGSKCWYCGTVLCRYKQHWIDVKIYLGRGKIFTGRDIGSVTPYYGRPTHDHVGDFTVNACSPCTSRRHRKPIEEYRQWLTVRMIANGQALQSQGAAYRFYAEELMLCCGRAWTAQCSVA